MKLSLTLLISVLSFSALASDHLSCNSEYVIGNSEFATKAYMEMTLDKKEVVHIYSIGGLSVNKDVTTKKIEGGNFLYTSNDDTCSVTLSIPDNYYSAVDFEGSVSMKCGETMSGPYELACHLSTSSKK